MSQYCSTHSLLSSHSYPRTYRIASVYVDYCIFSSWCTSSWWSACIALSIWILSLARSTSNCSAWRSSIRVRTIRCHSRLLSTVRLPANRRLGICCLNECSRGQVFGRWVICPAVVVSPKNLFTFCIVAIISIILVAKEHTAIIYLNIL